MEAAPLKVAAAVRPTTTITKSIKNRQTRYVGRCWRSKHELISVVLLWTPSHGQAKAGKPARTYIQQLCADTGCCPERPAGTNGQ